VGAEGCAVENAAVGKDDLALAVRSSRDVAGGQDIAVLGDDDAAPLGRPDAYADGRGQALVQDGPDMLLNVLKVLDVLRDGLLKGWGKLGLIRGEKLPGRQHECKSHECRPAREPGACLHTEFL